MGGVAAVGLAGAGLVAPSLRPLIGFGLYSIPANSVVPLPHEPGLLYFALLAPALWLALAGAAGTFVAAYLDGWVIGWAFRRPTGQALCASRSWQLVTRWLLRAPFFTLLGVAFAGVPPIQAVRILVLSSGYSTTRYAVAIALGRFPRFFLIALAGQALGPPAWVMAALTVAFLVWPLVLLFKPRAPGLGTKEEPAS